MSIVLLLLAAAAGFRADQRRRLEPFVEITRTYFERALSGDSVGMRALAADDTVVRRTLALARGTPDRIRIVVMSVRAVSGWQDSVEAVVFFRTGVDWCAGAVGATDLQATFHLVNGAWKVYGAGPGPC